MNAKNPDGSYMTDEEIKVEALVLMVAATDTTAAFVGSFVQSIISNPAVYQRLRKEIQAFESEGKLAPGIVSYEQAQTLPYFSACIKESLRFSPSTPFMMPRLVSKGGVEINGVFVPEGTEMGANPWVLHRDTKIFGADAAQFNPDRWLESEARSKEMDKYIMTWGYGPRICLGKNIAQMITQKLCLEVRTDVSDMASPVAKKCSPLLSSSFGSLISNVSLPRSLGRNRIWQSWFIMTTGCISGQLGQRFDKCLWYRIAPTD